MKAVKVKDSLYKELKEISNQQKVSIDKLLLKILQEGIESLRERLVLDLYRDRKVSLQKAAEMLSIDIWDMIDRIKRAEIYLDYEEEDLKEDISK